MRVKESEIARVSDRAGAGREESKKRRGKRRSETGRDGGLNGEERVGG